MGTTDFYIRLNRITDYIQKNVRYFVVERGIGGLQAHPAADIFRNHYGDCKDKTTLLISMLQVAGIQAYYVPVDDRRGVVDPNEPSIYGNHMITAIEIPDTVQDARLQAVVKAKNGKRYLIFDPTNERTPVGNLPSYEQGSYGLLATGSASQILALPVLDPDSNGTENKDTFTLESDGSLTGSVDTSHTGPDGADLRMMLKYTDEKERHDYLERTIGHDIHGVTLDSFNFIQPDALDKPIEFQYKVTAPQYAHVAGPLLLVRPRVVGDDAISFDEKPRTLPIEFEATGRWRDSFDITLPPGYVVDETPEPVNVKLDFADYHSSVTAKGNVLHYERELVVRQVEIPASRAADFRKLQGEIEADQQGAAVLKNNSHPLVMTKRAMFSGSASHPFSPLRIHLVLAKILSLKASPSHELSAFFSFPTSLRSISQSHRRLAHVSVLRGRWLRQRLAFCSLGQPRAGRRRAGHHGGFGGSARRPHLA